MGDSRTILSEHLAKGKESPLEGGCYSVISSRLPGYGGFGSHRIDARVIDDHYVIVSRMIVNDSRDEKILGIVDIDKPEEAEKKLYKEALKVAKGRARQDRDKLLDITSRVKILPREAEHYCGMNWSGSPNYWDQKRKRAAARKKK